MTETTAGGARWRWRTPAAVGLLLAIGLGIWVRVRGLGVSPLATDEYYFARSVEQLLRHGFPVFETGGVYARGILVQYVTAPWMLLVDSVELAIRIPSVVFGLAVAWITWHYGRRTLGRRYAVALVLMILLSSWEVEFSRFGRMYAGFQAATMAMLVVWHDGVTDGRGRRLYWIPVLCLVALLTHQLAVLLVPLVFVPLFIPGFARRIGGRRALAGYFLAALLVALLAVVLQQVDFRSLGVTDPYPSGFSPRPGNTFLLPYFPFWRLSSDAFLNVVALSAAFGLVGAMGAVLVRRKLARASEVVAALMLLATLAHQLLVSALLGLVLLLRYRLHRDPEGRRRAVVLAGAATLVAAGWVCLAAWLTYGLGSRSWIEAGGFVLLRDAATAAFVWPNPWATVIEPWVRDLPIIATLVGIGLAVQFVIEVRRPLVRIIRNPGFILAYLLVVLGVLEPLFQEARYTFFVYPVVLAVIILSTRDVCRWLARRLSWFPSAARVAVPAVILAFGLSGDFHPRHLLEIDSPEAVLRAGEFEMHEGLWYPRDDVVGPARFVDESASGDSVIVQEAPEVSYYLDRSHAVYLVRDRFRFQNVSRRQGTTDFWSGLALLSTTGEIADYTRCASRVWVIRMARDDWIPIEAAWPNRLRRMERVHAGSDGAVEVVRIDLTPPSCQ